MKNKLTLSLLIGLHIQVFGQETEKIYLDEYDFPTTEIRDAKSYRVISQHPTEQRKLLVKEYYANDTVKQIGTFSDIEIFTKDGFFVSYHSNGQKSEEGFYKENFKIGKWIKWYRNGQIQEESSWDNSKDFNVRQYVSTFWDSLGNKLASSGNGDYILNEEYPVAYAKGPIKNGLKSGKWSGYFENGAVAFEEQYEANKLIKGISYDSLGQEYKYKKVIDSRNMMSLYEFIGENLRYPADARRFGTEGTVVIQILFATNGQIIKSRIVKGIGNGCNEEALRVVTKYKGNWDSGKKRGQPLKWTKPQSMYFPIIFKLG